MLPAVLITLECLEALDRIPQAQRKKVREFIKKFLDNPKLPGINYEKIQGIRDDKVWTARIDIKYRAVILHHAQGDEYTLVWVDKHDAATDWAKGRDLAFTRALRIAQPTRRGQVVPPTEASFSSALVTRSPYSGRFRKEREQQQREEAKRRQRERERLQHEGETKLTTLIRDALERNQGTLTQADKAEVNELRRQHRVPKERAKEIVSEAQKELQKVVQPAEPQRQLASDEDLVGTTSSVPPTIALVYADANAKTTIGIKSPPAAVISKNDDRAVAKTASEAIRHRSKVVSTPVPVAYAVTRYHAKTRLPMPNVIRCDTLEQAQELAYSMRNAAVPPTIAPVL